MLQCLKGLAGRHKDIMVGDDHTHLEKGDTEATSLLAGRFGRTTQVLRDPQESSQQHPDELSQYRELLTSNDHYVASRKLWSDGCGFPFHLPHLTTPCGEENELGAIEQQKLSQKFVGDSGRPQTSARTKISRSCNRVWLKLSPTRFFARCVSVMQEIWVFCSRCSHRRVDLDVLPTPPSPSVEPQTTHEKEPEKEHVVSTVSLPPGLVEAGSDEVDELTQAMQLRWLQVKAEWKEARLHRPRITNPTYRG